MIVIDRVQMRKDFWYRLIEKYFEQLINLVRVLRPQKANDFEHYCATAYAGTCQTHMYRKHLMNRCTKYGAIDLLTQR